MNRTEYTRIRLTKEEKKKLTEKSDNLNIGLSEYLRLVGLNTEVTCKSIEIEK